MLGVCISAVLFTLLLVIDLQMDLGMSGHHLVPSHGKVKLGSGLDRPYTSFQKRFLQRSNNGSREMSGAGATSASGDVAGSNTNNANNRNNNASVLGGATRLGITTLPSSTELEDNFHDLLEYVIGEDKLGKISRTSVRSRKSNPTIGQLLRLPIR